MKTRTVLLTGCMVLTSALAGCGYITTSSGSSLYGTPATNSASGQVDGAAATGTSVPWLRIDKNTQTVSLDITAAQTNDNHGFNFNGYSNGAMTITVPQNWHVNVNFKNVSASIPHSVLFVPYDERTATHGFQNAFTGSASPGPNAGILSGQTQSFHFIADKVGQYAMVCGVPGHSSEGLWDAFVVSSTADTPAVSISANSGSESGVGAANGYSASGDGY